MNKAFIREADAPPARCPRPQGCDQLGTAVPAGTLAVWMPESRTRDFSSEVFYCSSPECPVAYFDGWGNWVSAGDLSTLPYPKNPDGFVCVCLGVKPETVLSEAVDGRREKVLEILTHAKGPDAKCESVCPDGRSCERVVRRLFLENFRR